MKNFRNRKTSVNTGSMADIAFLLLIFFLVSTTISSDKGILRQLPPDCSTIEDCIANVKERNILRIYLNNTHEIFIEDDQVAFTTIQSQIKSFIDNNGASNCNYCKGNGSESLSEHPSKAVISLSYNSMMTYKQFIAVQDEITKAIDDLRADYIRNTLNKTSNEVTEKDLAIAKIAYPLKISESHIKHIQ